MIPAANFHLEPATAADAVALAFLHTAAAQRLTELHGKGPWSSATSERGVLHALRTSKVYLARLEGQIVATLRLSTRKPWAIDAQYFTPVTKPLYLVGMAVTPSLRRRGLGRKCLEEVKRIARAWPADAIRLDAYDTSAGAGEFYTRCGWRETGRATYRNAALIYYELLLH